jgi:hypothetical protein
VDTGPASLVVMVSLLALHKSPRPGSDEGAGTRCHLPNSATDPLTRPSEPAQKRCSRGANAERTPFLAKAGGLILVYDPQTPLFRSVGSGVTVPQLRDSDNDSPGATPNFAERTQFLLTRVILLFPLLIVEASYLASRMPAAHNAAIFRVPRFSAGTASETRCKFGRTNPISSHKSDFAPFSTGRRSALSRFAYARRSYRSSFSSPAMVLVISSPCGPNHASSGGGTLPSNSERYLPTR